MRNYFLHTGSTDLALEGLAALLQALEHLGLSPNCGLECNLFYISPIILLLVAAWENSFPGE